MSNSRFIYQWKWQPQLSSTSSGTVFVVFEGPALLLPPISVSESLSLGKISMTSGSLHSTQTAIFLDGRMRCLGMVFVLVLLLIGMVKGLVWQKILGGVTFFAGMGFLGWVGGPVAPPVLWIRYGFLCPGFLICFV